MVDYNVHCTATYMYSVYLLHLIDIYFQNNTIMIFLKPGIHAPRATCCLTVTDGEHNI